MRVDADLATRLDRAIGASSARYARTRADQFGAAIGARVLELRPGVVAVDSGAGGGENASSAFGLGLGAPVSPDQSVNDLARIERFYEEGRPPRAARVHASPFADPTLHDVLAARGFRPVRFSALVAADADAEAPTRATSGAALRTLGVEDIDALLSIEQACYGAHANDDEREAARKGSLPLLAGASTMWAAFLEVDGAEIAAACGALVVEDGVGLLFAGMCRPELRGRGLQSALVRARMKAAQERGLDLVASLAAPGTTSERNLRRAGFELVCTTTLWERKR